MPELDAQIDAWPNAKSGFYAIEAGLFAAKALTRVASKEIGRGIRVNSVSPGPTDTELYRKGKSPEIIARQAALSPFNRIGLPAEIAPVVVFLASEMSRYMIGEQIHVDGGLHLPGYNSRPAGVPVKEY